MFKINRFTLVSLLLIGAYVLSACGGVAPQGTSPDVAQKVQSKEIVFTGVIESINGTEWIVSGQKVTVDPSASLDPNLAVGVIVKVEGQMSADGTVTALKVETSAVSDDNANDGNANDNGNTNDDNSNDGNANDDANANANTNDDNSNTANDNSAAAGGNQSEVFGVVESITTESITVNGVTYMLAGFTEIKDAIAVGDQVKIHILVNADGTFTIREIERSDDFGDDNGNDDNSNDDNGNDDNSNDDNGNDDNSNDDNGNDDNSNSSNGNDDGGNSGKGGNDNDDDDDDDNGNDD